MMTYMNATSPLANAFEHVKILRKLIPICAWCKCIRDEDGHWNAAEDSFHAQADADFTHTICPTCLEEERRKLNWLACNTVSAARSPVSTVAAIAC
jgi:hypothetical protein